MPACTMCGFNPEREPVATWKVEAVGWLPSQNNLGGNHKTGFKYRNIRRNFEKTLADQLNAIPRATKFREAIITRQFGKTKHGRWCRPYDHANLVGGAKPLVDTLKAFAVILDDRDDTFRGHYRQERSADGVDRYNILLMEYA